MHSPFGSMLSSCTASCPRTQNQRLAVTFVRILSEGSRMDRKGTITPPFSEYLTVEQVATILNVSTDTVARQFGKMEGVIDLGTPERLHKRRRRILRIPATGWSGSSLSGRFVVVANNRFAVVWRGIDYSGAESPE